MTDESLNPGGPLDKSPIKKIKFLNSPIKIGLKLYWFLFLPAADEPGWRDAASISTRNAENLTTYHFTLFHLQNYMGLVHTCANILHCFFGKLSKIVFTASRVDLLIVKWFVKACHLTMHDTIFSKKIMNRFKHLLMIQWYGF